MKPIFLALLAAISFALAGACALIPDYDYGPLVLADLDFERRSFTPWEGQFTAEGRNFSLEEVQPAAGLYCGKFRIGAGGDYWKSPNNQGESARSELQLKNTAPAGRELYYSWKLKIDPAYPESKDWQVIGQFHDQPDPAMGQTWALYPANSPPVAFRYEDGHLVLAVYSWAILGVKDIASLPLTKGEWHRITTRILWSTGNGGFVEAWLDGVPLKFQDGTTRHSGRNCFNNAGNYLKIGLYRSRSIQTEGIVYYDDVKSGLSWQSVH